MEKQNRMSPGELYAQVHYVHRRGGNEQRARLRRRGLARARLDFDRNHCGARSAASLDSQSMSQNGHEWRIRATCLRLIRLIVVDCAIVCICARAHMLTRALYIVAFVF